MITANEAKEKLKNNKKNDISNNVSRLFSNVVKTISEAINQSIEKNHDCVYFYLGDEYLSPNIFTWSKVYTMFDDEETKLQHKQKWNTVVTLLKDLGYTVEQDNETKIITAIYWN